MMNNKIYTSLFKTVLIAALVFTGLNGIAYIHHYKIEKHDTETKSNAESNAKTRAGSTTKRAEVTSKSIEKIEVIGSLEFEAETKTGYIGIHPKDPSGKPGDDFFKVDIDRGLDQLQFAFISYEVKGVNDGQDLPKSINGSPSYIHQRPERGNSKWQTIRHKIKTEELVEGTNSVRFTMPPNGFPVEVRNVKVVLTAESGMERIPTQVIRMNANNSNFQVLKLKQQLEDLKDQNDQSTDNNNIVEVEKMALVHVDLAYIPTTLLNVTRGAYAYKMEGGSDELYRIKVGVDSEQFGQFDKQELQLFYFNTEKKKWDVAQRISYDEKSGMLEAAAPGNSDYFTGLIKTPEMPEASAFAPTAISDIKAADPSAGMTLIAPPDVSRTGEAGISYPLTIPGGRNGMQPQLALNYSSDGGTGWIGMGWSISIPEISVETRWGVPTFDDTYQSEVYLLNGSSLTEQGGKKANKGFTKNGSLISPSTRDTGTVRFFERTMTSYKTIERRGNSTSTYYWIETTADQTKFYYGCIDSTGALNDLVLKNDNSDIVRWKLGRVEDQWGNFIDYEYNKETVSSSNKMIDGGKRMHIESIVYTGHGATKGKYSVQFVATSGREDATVSLKSSVKQVDDLKLNRINITYDTSIVKSYRFGYTEGAFFKTLLDSVAEYRSDSFFYKHDFEYNTDTLKYATNPEKVALNPTSVKMFDKMPKGLKFLERPLAGLSDPSSPRTSTSIGWRTGGNVGIGIAPGTWPLQNKSWDFSASLGYSENYNKQRISLQDLSGDGLPDLVYDKVVGRGYSPLGRYESGRQYFGAYTPIDYEGRLSRSKSKTFSTAIDYVLPKGVIYAGVKWDWTTSQTKTYLMDYNADGIVDLMTPSRVLFGRINNKGHLDFSASSWNTPNAVVHSGQTIATSAAENQMEMDFELVKSWRAPLDGSVEITGTAKIISGYPGTVDVSIQHNDSVISGTDVQITTGSPKTYSETVTVEKDDLLLFRSQHGDDGVGDFVQWNPAISYSSKTFSDPNDVSYTQSNYDSAFLLSGGESIAVRYGQAFRIEPNIEATELTDHIHYTITVSYEGIATPYSDTYTRIDSAGTEGLTSSFSIDVPGSKDINDMIDAFDSLGSGNSRMCYISFLVKSSSNVAWKKINWNPAIYLKDSCDYTVDALFPTVQYKTYNRVHKLEDPHTVNTLPSDSFTVKPKWNSCAPSNSEWEKVFTYEEDSIGTGGHMSYMVVKSGGLPLSKLEVHINANKTITYNIPPAGPSVACTTTNNHNFPKLHYSTISNQEISVEFFAPSRRVGQFLVDNLSKCKFVDFNSPNSDITNFNVFSNHRTPLQDYSQHWGQFAWSGEANSDIDTADLKIAYEDSALANSQHENSMVDTSLIKNLVTDSNKFNNVTEWKFFPLNAVRGENSIINLSYIDSAASTYDDLDHWGVVGSQIGIYRMGYLTPGVLGESQELEADEVVVYSSFGAESRISESKSHSMSIATGYIKPDAPHKGRSVSLSMNIPDENVYSSQTIHETRDLNGDGYPDLITRHSDNGLNTHLSDAYGGYKASAVYNSSIYDAALISAVHLGFQGEFSNDRWVNKNGISAGASFSENKEIMELVDLNGDGLADRVRRDKVEDDLDVQLNLGDGFATAFDFDRLGSKNYLSKISTFSASLGYGYSKELKNWETPKTQRSLGFNAGVGVNANWGQTRKSWIDINGDGLVDCMERDSDDKVFAVYINKGSEFELLQNSVTYSQKPNKQSTVGVNAGVGGAYAIAVPSFLLSHFKISFGANASGNFSLSKNETVLMDMNGDRYPDLVYSEGDELWIYHAEIGPSNFLKKVTNPLGGFFDIEYELEGNKYGVKNAAVKTQTEHGDDMILWDMPEGKWVMSRVIINDGVDLHKGSDDHDGRDFISYTYNYDGGMKSRREREFLGFTRIEKRHPAYQPGYPMAYLTEVTEFHKPTSNDAAYRRGYEYLKNVPGKQYTLHNYIDTVMILVEHTPEITDTIIRYTDHEIRPMAVSFNSYEFRKVEMTKGSTTIGTVKKSSGDWVVADIKDMEETECLFPAVVSTHTLSYPQINDGHNEKFYSLKYDLKYDSLFNVIEYSNNGMLSDPTFDTTITDTIYAYRYQAYRQWNMTGNDPVDSNIVSTDSTSHRPYVYCIVSCEDSTYHNDTIAILLDDTVCLPSYQLDSFQTEHLRLVRDTFYEKTVEDNSVYTGSIIALMTYHGASEANGRTNSLMSHKIYLDTVNAAGLRRHTEVFELASSGKAPATIHNYLDATGYGATDISYNVYGQVDTITGPENHNGDRLKNTYVYDTTQSVFVEQVHNSYLDTARSYYDYATGLLEVSTDPNGHHTAYEYDEYFRLKQVYAPRELYNSDAAPTIAFEYLPYGHDPGAIDNLEHVPVALTIHNTYRSDSAEFYPVHYSNLPSTSSRPDIVDSLCTATFTDGMKRVIQIKKQATKDSATRVRTVSGIAHFNDLGQNDYSTNSTLDDSSNALTIICSTAADVMTETQYDYAGRPVWQFSHTVDGSSSVVSAVETEYGWDLDTASKDILYTQTKLYNGELYTDTLYGVPEELSHVRAYKDPWGRTILQEQYGTSDTISTIFEYNALSELLNSTNPLGLTTSYEYDNYGRRTEETHPDRGVSTLSFDYAGNLTKVITPATDTTGIVMEYEYNRLTDKTVPTTASMYNVEYSYGEYGDSINGAGRVIQVVQGTDFKTEKYEFDELGNLVFERKEIEVPKLGLKTFNTEFEYDSWGRILKMIYPDDEKIFYFYNNRAELQSIESGITHPNPSGTHYVIKNIDYDGFGNIEVMEYGNGAINYFGYGDKTRRMNHVHVNTITDLTSSPGRSNILFKSISYDVSGRILGVSNTDSALCTTSTYNYTLGGPYQFRFDYDKYNRLKTADEDTASYKLTMAYNTAGGITEKLQEDFQTGTQLHYDAFYTYQPTSPHQIKEINSVDSGGDTTKTQFVYNSSGSIEVELDNTGWARQMHWNEEQQLTGIESDEEISHYIYDQGGERVMKGHFMINETSYNGQTDTGILITQDPYTIYTNAYYVETEYDNAKKTSKHYYMGTQRIATDVKLTSTEDEHEEEPGLGFEEGVEELIEGAGYEEGEDYDIDSIFGLQGVEQYYPVDTSEANFGEPEGGGGGLYSYSRLMYWYHPDYLGNTEYTTAADGMPYEYFQYAPFGESIKHHTAEEATYLTDYKFSAKELDLESGLYYYGARYYNPETSIWLSVDPLSEERAWLTPYNFVQNNPILRIDPDGMLDDIIFYNTNGREVHRIESETVNEVYIVSSDDGNQNHNTMTHLIQGANTVETAQMYVGMVPSEFASPTDVSLQFSGNANENNNAQADGTLSVWLNWSGGNINVGSYDAISGPHGNGALENGDYDIGRVGSPRNPGSGYTDEGVAFTVDLEPTFNTGRTHLRIHPDGTEGSPVGTAGCIGLSNCSAKSLRNYYNNMQTFTRAYNGIQLNVNILNNPNNAGR